MIRTLHETDATEVAALIRHAFGAISVPLDPAPSALRTTEAEVLEKLASGGGAVWEQEGLRGCVLWQPREDALYLSRLAVAPGWQGRGIARSLIGRVEAEARARGLRRVQLEVRLALAGNRRLFAACGFKEGALRSHPGHAEPTFVEAEKRLVPRLLLINPNTTVAMTAAMATQVAKQLGARAELRTVTAAFGHPVIASRVSYAVAAHAALDAYGRAGEGADAVILGCFGDPGLEALREVARVPVIGLAEAAFRSAIQAERSFSVLTVGPAWSAMLQERVNLLPGASLCRRILALEGTGLDFANLTATRLDMLNAAIRKLAAEGAETVILGGAALAGIAPRLHAPVPLLDCVGAATEHALRAVDTAPMG